MRRPAFPGRGGCNLEAPKWKTTPKKTIPRKTTPVPTTTPNTRMVHYRLISRQLIRIPARVDAQDDDILTSNHSAWSPGSGGEEDDKAGSADMAKMTIDNEGNIAEGPEPTDGGEPPGTRMSLDYQKSTVSLLEFFKRIPDEDAAVAFVEKVRWGDGRFCPQCTSESTYRVENGRPMPYRCRSCKRYFSVRVNSVFHETGIPLQKWLLAIYMLHTGRAGVSSHEFSRDLGITQKSAWFMGHRIREGMVQSGEALSGEVEVDEAYIGGLLSKMHKSRREWLKETDPERMGKVIVMGIKERKTGRVWTTIVPNTEIDTLQKILGERLQPGTVVYSDGHPAYEGIEYMFDFAHEVAYHSGPEKQYVRTKVDENGETVYDEDGNPVLVHTNGIEGFWSLFKRGYRGVYFYMSPKHLHRYLNESCFRQGVGNKNNFAVIEDTVRRMFGQRLTHKRLTGKA